MSDNDLTRICFEKVKQANISTLQNMYSPMFDKKFSEMTDEEIKSQLDVWNIDGSFENKLGKNIKSYYVDEAKTTKKEQRKQEFRNFMKRK